METVAGQMLAGLRTIIQILLAAMVVWISTGPASAAKRIALLIGNQAYNNAVGPLKNPHNDVGLVGAALRKIGFEVHTLQDASYRQMDIAIRQHADRLHRAGASAIGFFYFSGHGVANPDTRANYLLPTDIVDAKSDAFWYSGFEQSLVIDRLRRRASNATHYVVFDACRNELKLGGKTAKSVGDQKGFVPVTDTTGILIAYATAPLATASDEGVGGGTYAKALSAELVQPGIEAVTMFRRVQLRVKHDIGQDPWLSIPTLPEIYLAGRQSPADIRWDAIKNTTNATDLQTYLKRFPTSRFSELARSRLKLLELQRRNTARDRIEEAKLRERLLAWNAIKDSDDIELLKAFANEFPDSFFATLAHRRIESLKRDKAKKPKPGQLASLPKPAQPHEQARPQVPTAPVSPKANTGTEIESKESPKLDKTELIRRLQSELERVGCYNAVVDGKWGKKSEKALVQALGKNASDLNPSNTLLMRLRQLKPGKCPTTQSNSWADPKKETAKTAVEPHKAPQPTRTRTCLTYRECLAQCTGSYCPTVCASGGSIYDSVAPGPLCK